MSPKRQVQLGLCLGVAPSGGRGREPDAPRRYNRGPMAARYFDLIREMRSAYNHRLRLVASVRQRGLKPTARLFQTSPLTVRKWWRRYQQHGPSGLRDLSRAPHRSPQKTSPEIEQQVLALRRQLPTFGAARLQREFDLPVSHMAIQRIWRQHGLLKKRRRR